MATNEALDPSMYRNAREEIVSRWNDLLEEQMALDKHIKKYINDFGQMPLLDEALQSMHFGMAHVIDSYTKIHNAALKALPYREE